ncbi:MAG: hypothetical protein ACRDSM_20770, partial [Pseudonocardiaceae bacterium]
AKQNGEVVFHFTPPGASWMNRIEIWNGIIARKLIRRGTFKSVKALNRDIEVFVKQWNSDCKPITWTATVEEISTRSVLSRPTWTLSCVPPRLTMWPVGQRK